MGTDKGCVEMKMDAALIPASFISKDTSHLKASVIQSHSVKVLVQLSVVGNLQNTALLWNRVTTSRAAPLLKKNDSYLGQYQT